MSCPFGCALRCTCVTSLLLNSKTRPSPSSTPPPLFPRYPFLPPDPRPSPVSTADIGKWPFNSSRTAEMVTNDPQQHQIKFISRTINCPLSLPPSLGNRATPSFSLSSTGNWSFYVLLSTYTIILYITLTVLHCPEYARWAT